MSPSGKALHPSAEPGGEEGRPWDISPLTQHPLIMWKSLFKVTEIQMQRREVYFLLSGSLHSREEAEIMQVN